MKQMPQKMAFIVHPERNEAWTVANHAEQLIKKEGLAICYPQKGEDPSGCGMILTFGGDGTLLMGAKAAIEANCPLLGINLGTVGFLTEGDPTELEMIVRTVLSESWETESRSLLEVKVEGEEERFFALNDAVITRGGYARLIQVETTVNQEHWGTFIADGVIAATPTGSTGYSLSAGGPVVVPDVKCTIITPVCAHSLQNGPCIVPDQYEIRFHLREERDQQAELQIDGQRLRRLQAGSSVIITGAAEKLKLVRLRPYHFFDVMRKKFNQWSRSEKGD